jgi:hypothetical protein
MILLEVQQDVDLNEKVNVKVIHSNIIAVHTESVSVSSLHFISS